MYKRAVDFNQYKLTGKVIYKGVSQPMGREYFYFGITHR